MGKKWPCASNLDIVGNKSFKSGGSGYRVAKECTTQVFQKRGGGEGVGQDQRPSISEEGGE